MKCFVSGHGFSRAERRRRITGFSRGGTDVLSAILQSLSTVNIQAQDANRRTWRLAERSFSTHGYP
jgi:hypothetical protein